MLSKIEKPRQNPPKQVAAYTSANNTVMYTVPDGRGFIGHLTNAHATYKSGVYINGVSVQLFPEQMHPVELLAGTVIKTNSAYPTTLIGVEK